MSRNYKMMEDLEQLDEEYNLDPRIKEELDNLNMCSDLINKLENEFQRAKEKFERNKGVAKVKLAKIHRKCGGKNVSQSKQYWDMQSDILKLRSDIVKSALSFMRCQERYKTLKESLSNIEGDMNEPFNSSNALLMERLNNANNELVKAKLELSQTERDHLLKICQLNQMEKESSILWEKQSKIISASKSYYSMKQELERKLKAECLVAEDLNLAIHCSRQRYQQSLDNLENISNEEHLKRRTTEWDVGKGKRTPGVGAERTSPDENDYYIGFDDDGYAERGDAGVFYGGEDGDGTEALNLHRLNRPPMAVKLLTTENYENTIDDNSFFNDDDSSGDNNSSVFDDSLDLSSFRFPDPKLILFSRSDDDERKKIIENSGKFPPASAADDNVEFIEKYGKSPPPLKDNVKIIEKYRKSPPPTEDNVEFIEKYSKFSPTEANIKIIEKYRKSPLPKDNVKFIDNSGKSPPPKNNIKFIEKYRKFPSPTEDNVKIIATPNSHQHRTDPIKLNKADGKDLIQAAAKIYDPSSEQQRRGGGLEQRRELNENNRFVLGFCNSKNNYENKYAPFSGGSSREEKDRFDKLDRFVEKNAPRKLINDFNDCKNLDNESFSEDFKRIFVPSSTIDSISERIVDGAESDTTNASKLESDTTNASKMNPSSSSSSSRLNNSENYFRSMPQFPISPRTTEEFYSNFTKKKNISLVANSFDFATFKNIDCSLKDKNHQLDNLLVKYFHTSQLKSGVYAPNNRSGEDIFVSRSRAGNLGKIDRGRIDRGRIEKGISSKYADIDVVEIGKNVSSDDRTEKSKVGRFLPLDASCLLGRDSLSDDR